MATMTLLDMTQNILDAMDSDSVNSIADTDEAQRVAKFIRETYFDILSSKDWPFLKQYTTLTALGDTTYPTKMQFPSTASKIYWIKYNKKDVVYMDPKDFQDMLDARTAATGVTDSNGFNLTYDPKYWTTFDDTYIWFDSIDTSVDTTLQASKSKAYMLITPAWTHTDIAIPTLPEKMFPLLLADAKGTCFLNLKQTANAKEERKSQRLRVRMARESVRANDAEVKSNSNVDYGRRSNPTGRIRHA